MQSIPPISRSKRFSTRLFVVFSLFILAVSVAFILFFCIQQYTAQRKNLLNDGHVLILSLASELRLAVFAENRTQASAIANKTTLFFPNVRSVTVLGSNGHVLAHVMKQRATPEERTHDETLLHQESASFSPTNTVLTRQVDDDFEFIAPVMAAPRSGGVEGLLFPGQQVNTAAVPLGAVRVVIDTAGYRNHLRKLAFMSAIAMGGFLVCGMIVAYAVARSMTRPIAHLTKGVAALESGNLEVRVPVETNDEIGVLAKKFNQLASRLRQQTDEREAAEAQIISLNAHLEEKVQQRTADLEATTRELELFNYSASHDLRAPLARLAGYCEVMREDCGEHLDSDGHYYLAKIAAVGEQMGQVVAAMTTLFNVQRHNLLLQDLDLANMVRSIVASLQEGEPERNCRLSVPQCVPARGDENLVQIALENLLSNAWKFSSSRAETMIEFGVLPEEDNYNYIFFLQDNGVGFDKAYADKLFKPFERLHSLDDFPGTGVGLAIVQRAIEHHGGHIWFESTVNEGARFFFTLPGSPFTGSGNRSL